MNQSGMTQKHSEKSHAAGCCSAHAGHDHGHEHTHGEEEQGKSFLIKIVLSVVLLLLSVAFDYWSKDKTSIPYREAIILGLSILAYLPVGYQVIREGLELAFEHRDLFNELMLMSVATIAAFAIGEYHESVLLMLLYNIGEWLQDRASAKAHRNIKQLIDIRPKTVTLVTPQGTKTRLAKDCSVGDRLRLLPGDRLALDASIASEGGTFDYASLTGESIPVDLTTGDEVPAGAIVLSKPVDVLVRKPFEDSTLSRIVNMVEHSSERKPDTERFIRRFARIYTPIVVGIALLVTFVPYLYALFTNGEYAFRQHLYNGLVFLVASCPCALVISVPLSFFGGVGAASRKGLLFKGALFLDRLRHIRTFVFDKTGTLTEGSFSVREAIRHADDLDVAQILAYTAAAEGQSTHPIAKAIVRYAEEQGVVADSTLQTEEITGLGMRAVTGKGEEVLVGNKKLLEKFGVSVVECAEKAGSKILIALSGRHVMSLLLADKVKETSRPTIDGLRKRGYQTVMLSGDNKETVAAVGNELGIDHAIGSLLPDGKIAEIEKLRDTNSGIAFVGDGLNDAPVMALADISFAMGGIGSDTTIEVADVVIQSDDPYRTVVAVDIARYTYKIVVENIVFALAVKLVVMLFAALGAAQLWWAILADVGVTLLAILNSLRALHYKQYA